MNLRRAILISAVLVGIFLFTQVSWAADTDIVINEIAAYEASDYEWIEIFNSGNDPVDMTGWKFYENSTNHGLSLYQGADMTIESSEYAIIADVAVNFASSHPAFSGTIIDSAWTTLSESGEAIELRTSTDPISVIELFTYLSAPDFSLERADSTWNDYSSNNWWEHSISNTAGAQNSNYGQAVTTTSITFSPSDIVINEFVSDPISGDKEWIELYNNTSTADLTSWTIEDGTGKILDLTGSIDSQNFLVFELSSSKLNNAGDIIILKDNTGQIIDSVTYGSWDDGDTSDNAPKSDDPNSTARNTDGVDTDIDNSDFSSTISPTSGSANSITTESNDPDPAPVNTGGGTKSMPSFNLSDIVINEFVSDPCEDQSEWIELYNNSLQTITLLDWTIEDGSEKVTELSGVIYPGSFVVVEEPKGSLNNGGDIIILYDPAGSVIDQVSYGGLDDGNLSDNAPKSNDPNSVARNTDGLDTNHDFNDFVVTSSVTKGATNVISVAGAGDSLENPENYSTAVIVNEVYPNPAGKDDAEFIELKNISETAVDIGGWKLGDGSSKRHSIAGGTVIEPGELLLVKRSVSQIALNNTGNEQVGLYWPSGSMANVIKYSGKVPEAQSYSRDSSGTWFWTETVTPGTENVIKLANQPPSAVINVSASEVDVGQKIIFDASDSTDDGLDLKYEWDFGDGATSTEVIIDHSYSGSGEYKVFLTVLDGEGASHVVQQMVYVGMDQYFPDSFVDFGSQILPSDGFFDVELVDVRNFFKGDKVKVRGVVSVEPGVLGLQIFYVAGSGIQIYSYKKDFPALVVGDYVEIFGELSESGGETRIKTKQSADIKVLEKNIGQPEAHEMSLGEIGEDCEGFLVKVSGEVIEKRGSSIYIDDGDEEVRVYIKESTGISIKNLSIRDGDWLTLTGIVSQTRTGYRILPRYPNDIFNGVVLGEKQGNNDDRVGLSADNAGLFADEAEGWYGGGVNKYLLAIAIFFIALSGWLGFKYWRLKKKGWEIVEE